MRLIDGEKLVECLRIYKREAVSVDDLERIISLMPSAEPERVDRDPEQIARDIATIIENEKDMRVILKNSEPEIIRCKDCEFWTCIKRTNRYWCKTDDGLYDLNPSPDDFCSRAVRRTNNDSD